MTIVSARTAGMSGALVCLLQTKKFDVETNNK